MNAATNYFLSALRILTGWLFLYEGVDKLLDTGWTARYYLLGSRWILSGFFEWIAGSSFLMAAIDFLNVWGLIVIGLFLFIGLFIRWVSVAGIVLLSFFFIAYPPIPGYDFGSVSEGSYLWVNKNLILAVVLGVFAVIPKSFTYGVDRLIRRWKEEAPHSHKVSGGNPDALQHRRELLRNLISIPFIGAFAYALYKKKKWDSWEEKFLADQTDGTTGATLLSFSYSQLDDLKGEIPKGRIGDMELSRLIMGGNLIGGWAHARDLIYASQLVKSYHDDRRVLGTMELAEKCGINSIITNPSLARVINKYWHETSGRMKFISDCGYHGGILEGVRMSEEAGASAMYYHGGYADSAAASGNFDDFKRVLDLIRSYGKPAGIGAHRLETIVGCVANGIKPDFWVKTFHYHNYWSAQVAPDQKNIESIWCDDPAKTIAFMNQLEEPWIAFKVLAAGAIKPEEGFIAAFEAGADFICVGMYDFQIVQDCNIALDALSNVKQRTRPWRG